MEPIANVTTHLRLSKDGKTLYLVANDLESLRTVHIFTSDETTVRVLYLVALPTIADVA